MKRQLLAYHVVVHALEDHPGWTPMLRFAAAVRHANNGHLPYARHYAAGQRSARNGMSETQIERAVSTFLGADLTSGVRILSRLSSPALAIQGFNQYNAYAALAVRTSVAFTNAEDTQPIIVMRQPVPTASHDPHPCRIATFALLTALIAQVKLNASRGYAEPRMALSDLARELGIGASASAEVATVLETQGAMPIPQLAQLLGTHPRTLERQLSGEGLTATEIRTAVRIIRATDRLGSDASLTTIALDEGYADLAHMTRAFRLASGMPPSLLRQLIQADATKKLNIGLSVST